MKKHWVLSYPLSALWRLIRLGGCPGWSESLLGAHVILLVLSCGGSFLKLNPWHIAKWHFAKLTVGRNNTLPKTHFTEIVTFDQNWAEIWQKYWKSLKLEGKQHHIFWKFWKITVINSFQQRVTTYHIFWPSVISAKCCFSQVSFLSNVGSAKYFLAKFRAGKLSHSFYPLPFISW